MATPSPDTTQAPALPGPRRTTSAKRQAGYVRRLRNEALELYGGVCAECGFSDSRALQFDHVNENGRKHRDQVGSAGILRAAITDFRLNGRPGRFQLLCANCNWIKRHELQEFSGRDFR